MDDRDDKLRESIHGLQVTAAKSEILLHETKAMLHELKPLPTRVAVAESKLDHIELDVTGLKKDFKAHTEMDTVNMDKINQRLLILTVVLVLIYGGTFGVDKLRSLFDIVVKFII